MTSNRIHQPYTIPKNVFEDLEYREFFMHFVGLELCEAIAKNSNETLHPSISSAQIADSYWIYKQKKSHISKNVMNGTQPSHLKLSAALFSSIMHTRPIYNVTFADEPQEKLPKFLVLHANEFSAFDLCFRICKAYEQTDEDGNIKKGLNFKVSREYIETFCAATKSDHLSTQSLYIIFKSLFEKVAS
jgi:hypothetical protein